MNFEKVIDNSPMLKTYFQKKKEYERDLTKKYIQDLKYQLSVAKFIDDEYLEDDHFDKIIDLLKKVKQYKLNTKQKKIYSRIKNATAELYVDTFYFWDATYESFYSQFN